MAEYCDIHGVDLEAEAYATGFYNPCPRCVEDEALESGEAIRCPEPPFDVCYGCDPTKDECEVRDYAKRMAEASHSRKDE